MDGLWQPFLFSLPAWAYLLAKRRGWASALDNLGWRAVRPIYYRWAAGLMLLSVGGPALASRWVLIAELTAGGFQYAGWPLTAGGLLAAWAREAVGIALGEEIFFRGLAVGLAAVSGKQHLVGLGGPRTDQRADGASEPAVDSAAG